MSTRLMPHAWLACSGVIVHAFPAGKPEAVVLLDAGRREVTTFVGEEIAGARVALAGYDIIAAVHVRGTPEKPGPSNPANAGSPSWDRRKRPCSSTSEAGRSRSRRRFSSRDRAGSAVPSATRWSCVATSTAASRRGAPAPARGGRQGALRALPVRAGFTAAFGCGWGFLDEMFPAPWVHRDEPTLTLMQRAYELRAPLRGGGWQLARLGGPLVPGSAGARQEGSGRVAEIGWSMSGP